MQKRQLVVIDTNIALSLATGDESAANALQLIASRMHSAQVLASPTVIQELTLQAGFDPELSRRKTACNGLASFQKHNIQPAPFDSTQEAITGKAGDELRHSGILPFKERNDSFVIAESATLNCVLLVSNDSHLLDIDPKQLGLFFREMDLPAPIIVSRRELIQEFYH
jgi:predicted nucleic acid-binding protein